MMLKLEETDLVSSIKSEQPISQIIATLRKIPRSELNYFCPKTNGSLLFYAVQRKDDNEALQICTLLCDEFEICDPLHVDRNKQVALFFAARDGNAKCVKYLIDKGCNPNHCDSAQQTALFYAARDGRIEAIQTLIDAGADINISDHLGQTALFYAARDGRIDAVLLMLKNGADIDMKDRHRRTALYYAMRNNYPQLVLLLKSWPSTSSYSNKEKLNSVDSNSQEPCSPLPTMGNTSQQISQTQPVPRKCYRLAIKGPFDETDNSNESSLVWISAPTKEIQKFELLYPNISVWSKDSSTPVSDIFHDFRCIWQPIAMNIIDELSQMEGGWVFSKPVDCKVWGCPDYYDVITNPMDFTTIKKKFKSNSYLRCADFIADMDLIFFNCFRYNRPESHVAQIGKSIQDTAINLYKTKGLEIWVERENILEKWYNNLDTT